MSPFQIVELVLRDQAGFIRRVEAGEGARSLAREALLASLLFLAVAGIGIGVFGGPPQVLLSAIKVPLVFLLAMAICLPSLYYFSLAFGANLYWNQVSALAAGSLAAISILSASFAPIAVFFWLTTDSYGFLKLLHVAIFGLVAVFGTALIVRAVKALAAAGGATGRTRAQSLVLALWLVLFVLVGTHLAWSGRPYLGSPGLEPALFRPVGDNFFNNVILSARDLVSPTRG